jgi:hypothetical protein
VTVGQRVTILTICDDYQPRVDVVGCQGTIKRVLGEGLFPVGQSTSDPLFIVDVPGVGTDGFWREELEVAP